MSFRFARLAGPWILAAVVTLGMPGCRFEVGEDEDVDAAIESMLRRSAAAWNAGDLDGFMAAFAEGASTSLMTTDGPVFGRTAIRAEYAAAFGPGAARDSLRLVDVQIRTLPPLVGVVTLRYVRERDGESARAEWATVVVRRLGEGWRIIHDHSNDLPE